MIEGTLVAKGKTKELRASHLRDMVEVYSLDDITAGNGARHDVLPGKGELATTTTCNMFDWLSRNGISVAYSGRNGPRTFVAWQCKMIKLEVVIRRVAGGSYLKRNPEVAEGTRFKHPIVEFYLKTSSMVWKGKDTVEHTLPVDDPFLSLEFKQGGFGVHDPRLPVDRSRPLFIVPFEDVNIPAGEISILEHKASQVFWLLESGWWRVCKARLKDLKIEAGRYGDPGHGDGSSSLWIADVIDNDSWRLEIDGKEVSKERYRQGAALEEVLKLYKLVARESERFKKLEAFK